MTELIPVEKGDQYLEVHPTTLAAHKAVGWSTCAQRSGADVAGPTRDDLIEALASLPGDYTDPEYVITHMRKHFGDLFLDVDEETIRNTVKPAPPKPSDGLSVDELKAKLAEKGIAIPAGARKPDLAKLLDEAPE